MASTVADVREEIGDTTEPLLFSETRVQLALDEAAEDLQARGVDIDTVQGSKRSGSWAIDLLDIHLARVRPPAASISESGKSISYTDLRQRSRRRPWPCVACSQITAADGDRV